MEMSSRIDELLAISDAISRGEIPKYQQNECYTAGAFDLLLISADAPTAFALLVEACNRFQLLKASGRSMEGYYRLLSLLVHRASTTEMPSGMLAIISEYPAFSSELRKWYRVGG